MPGSQVNANYPLTNTTPGLTLGRTFSSVAPTVSLVQPGLLFMDRIYQTDIRLSKSFKFRATTIRPTMNVYNLFNANTTEVYQHSYSAPGPTSTYLNPLSIMSARFFKITAQFDF